MNLKHWETNISAVDSHEQGSAVAAPASTVADTQKGSTATAPSNETSATPTEEKSYTTAKAAALLDSAGKLLLIEKEIINNAYEYVQKKNLSTGLIGYINGGEAPGRLTADSPHYQKVYELQTLAKSRDEIFKEFSEQVKQLNEDTGANAKPEEALRAMRNILLGENASSKNAMIAGLNALGQVNGEGAEIALPYLVYKDHTLWLDGVDKAETAQEYGREAWGWLKNVGASAKQQASDKFNKLQDTLGIGATADPDAAQGGASSGSETGEEKGGIAGWFSGIWEKMKDWKFGGIAGAAGVGSLFYLIGNALGGNSWLGKIIGVMAGLFGAVLGYRAFGGGGTDPVHSGADRAGNQQSSATTQGQEQEVQGRVIRNYHEVDSSYCMSGDADRDGVVSDQELASVFNHTSVTMGGNASAYMPPPPADKARSASTGRE